MTDGVLIGLQLAIRAVRILLILIFPYPFGICNP